MARTTEIALSSKIELIASTSLYDSYLGRETRSSEDNSPHNTLKRVLGIDLQLEDSFGTQHDATPMEVIMLKLVDNAMAGDNQATAMIIKEIEHDGVSKHEFIDHVPEDVAYLFKDIDFVDVSGIQDVEVLQDVTGGMDVDEQLYTGTDDGDTLVPDDKTSTHSVKHPWG